MLGIAGCCIHLRFSDRPGPGRRLGPAPSGFRWTVGPLRLRNSPGEGLSLRGNPSRQRTIKAVPCDGPGIMTVKSKRGRRRYIAFKVSPGLTAPELSQKVPRQFRVIQCAGGMAIVRCSPETADGCKAAVRRADPSSEPVRTSGTLRTLRARYRILRENAPPRPPRKVPPGTSGAR